MLLSDRVKSTFKDAAKKLTGNGKRDFMAKVTEDYFEGSARVSIDSKAKVKIGNLSRGGKARTRKPIVADDHDTEWQAILVPFGILNTH